MVSEKHLAIVKAERCGTLNQKDRSKQYDDPEPPTVLEQLNAAFTKIRELEEDLAAKKREIVELTSRVKIFRLKNLALTAIITGVCWEGVKALVTILVQRLSY